MRNTKATVPRNTKGSVPVPPSGQMPPAGPIKTENLSSPDGALTNH